MRLTEIVSPQDCVLAFALPLQESDFYEALQDTSLKDFAKLRQRHFPALSNLALWRNDYSKFVKRLATIFERVTQLGVTVITEFSHSQIPQLARFKAITLVTHWTGAAFVESDFLDVRSLLYKLLFSDGSIGEFLRSRCSHQQLLLLENNYKQQYTKEVRLVLKSILNSIIECPEFGQQFCAGIGLTWPKDSVTYQSYYNRILLEDFFGPIVREGNQLELFDGFCRITDFVNQIPDTFDGVFDLTVCNSVILQDSLRSRCNQSLVIANRKATDAIIRLLFYTKLIEILHDQPQKYAEAYANLRIEMQQTL